MSNFKEGLKCFQALSFFVREKAFNINIISTLESLFLLKLKSSSFSYLPTAHIVSLSVYIFHLKIPDFFYYFTKALALGINANLP